MAKFFRLQSGRCMPARAIGGAAAPRLGCGPKLGGAALDTFAKEAGLSRAHFFRLFESSIGLPPKVYLTLIRMEQAVDAVLNARRASGKPATNSPREPREFRTVSRLAS